MTIQKALDPIELYYQEYPEERDMAESYLHRDISEYLRDLLRWYYRSQACLLTANLVVYDANNKTSPDVAVIKGVRLSKAEQDVLSGWEVSPPERPAPAVVFEISSKDNWDKDIEPDKNQLRYGRLGVKEYFAFDPLGYWGEEVRLKGWRYSGGQPAEIEADAQGWLWSQELELYLVVQGAELKLYNSAKQLLLSKAEEEHFRAEQATYQAERASYQAEQATQQAAQASQQAEAERLRAEQATRQAEEERLRAEQIARQVEEAARQIEAERLQAEQAKQAAELERAAREALLAKLRARGIDPDSL
jgi:Uma2 family endonuclease